MTAVECKLTRNIVYLADRDERQHRERNCVVERHGTEELNMRSPTVRKWIGSSVVLA